MKCVICNTTGTSNPVEICLQSTTSGSVCSSCVDTLVRRAVMRNPRDFTDRFGNEWKEMDSPLFPDTRIKIMLPKEEEE
jgi:hypothetical protein